MKKYPRAKCSVEGCPSQAKVSGLCFKHGRECLKSQWTLPDKDFLASKVVVNTESGCWEGNGTSSGGYTTVHHNNRSVSQGHRLFYQAWIGPIPKGLHLDHLCRNRKCCNPWHLEAVTPGENALRGQGAAAFNKRKKSCSRGHEFTPENTGVTTAGHRFCKTCHTNSRKYRQEAKISKVWVPVKEAVNFCLGRP